MDIRNEAIAMIHYTPGITLTLIKDQIIEDIVQEENSIYLDFFHSKMIKHRAIKKKPRKTAGAFVEEILKLYLNIGNSD